MNLLYSQGGRTTPYNKTPFPTTQGPTKQPYRTLLKIRLNNGTIKPLMAMSDPLNPYLKVDEDTGNIIVYDSGGSIVFCLEMVNVKYNTFTSLTIDVEGNWVVSNKYSPGPEYSWNSGIVLPVFEYIGNNSYYYYDKNNQDRNTNVLYEFIEPTTPPTTNPSYTPPTTNPYKKTTIPYKTTVPQGSTPPPKPIYQFMCVDSYNNLWFTEPIENAPNSGLALKMFPMEKNVAQISFSNGKAAGVYANTGSNSFLIGNDGTVVDFTSANLKQVSYYGGQNGRSFVIGVNTGNEIWYSSYDFDIDITIMNGKNPYKYGIDTTAIKANYVSYAVDPSTGNDYVAVIDTAGDIQFFSMNEKSRNAMFPRPSSTKVSPIFYPITSDLLLTCMTMQIISTKQGVSMVNIVASSAVDNSKTGSAYLISFPVNNPNGDNIILLNTTPKTSLIPGIPNAMGITTISVSSSLPSNTFYMRDTTGRSYFLSDYTDINNFKGNAKAIENAVQLMLTNNKSIIQVSMDVYSHTNKPSWTPGEIITPKSYDYVYTNFDSQGSWNSILPSPYYTEISNADGKADDKCKELCDTKPLCVAASVYDAGNQTKQCRILDKIAGVDSTTEYITYVENVNFYSVKNKPFYKPQNGYDNFNHYWTYANYGNDIVSFIIPEKSGLDIDYVCRQACDYNPECSLCTVSHYGTTHTCWLKNEISSEGLKYDTNCNTYVKTDVGQPKFETFNIEEKYQGFGLTKLTGTTTEPITVVNGAFECSQRCDSQGDGCAGFYINNTQCTLYSQINGKTSDSGGNSYAKYVDANKAKISVYNESNIWKRTDKFSNFTVLCMSPAGWHEEGSFKIKLSCEAEVDMIGGSGGGGGGSLGSNNTVGGGGGGGGSGSLKYGKIGPGTFTIKIGKQGAPAALSITTVANSGGDGGTTYIKDFAENTVLSAEGGKGGKGGAYYSTSAKVEIGTGGKGGVGEGAGAISGLNGTNGGTTLNAIGIGGSSKYNPFLIYNLTVKGGNGGSGKKIVAKGGNTAGYNGDPGSANGTDNGCGWIFIKYYD